MNVVVITRNNEDKYMVCRHCLKSVQAGQVILFQRMLDGPTNNRQFVLHTRCVQKLLEKAPADTDERAYIELRDRIHATGEAFPDAV